MEEEIRIAGDLQKRFPQAFIESAAGFGDETILIKKDYVLPVMEFLRGEPFAFLLLLDLTCVDVRADRAAFEIVYHLYSLKTNLRVRVKTSLPEKEPAVDSLTGLWKNAAWLEREAFDMFGVEFRGHPDLRRILMYEGFEGFPLRKDFPLRRRQPRLPMKD
jgi:NADH-quinone oxidoreductase subunit C